MYIKINKKGEYVIKPQFNNCTNFKNGVAIAVGCVVLMHPATLKRSFVFLCEKANVENFRFHDLRHTSTTKMVGAGVPITMVKIF